MIRQHLLIRETLRFLLAALGVTALLIALSNLLLGPGFTAGGVRCVYRLAGIVKRPVAANHG
jgi:hypothetical protein